MGYIHTTEHGRTVKMNGLQSTTRTDHTVLKEETRHKGTATEGLQSHKIQSKQTKLYRMWTQWYNPK